MIKLSLVVTLISFSAATRAAAAAGPENWKAKCKSCHGDGGKADTKTGKKEKIKDMTVAAWQTEWTDEKMKKIISEGSPDNKKMKPFKQKLSADEIEGLIQVIRAFKQ